jgi:hypothetical protein
MSKKHKKGAPEAKKKIKKPAPEAKEASKKEAPKVPQETEKKGFVPKEIPDACTLVKQEWKQGKYGAYNPKSPACTEDCVKNYPESAAACKHNTETQAAMKAEKKKKGGNGKGVKKAGEKTPFGHDKNSGAGKIDMLLLRKEGATIEEMKACRGAVGSHLNFLKLHGATITKKNGKYFASAPKTKQ